MPLEGRELAAARPFLLPTQLTACSRPTCTDTDLDLSLIQHPIPHKGKRRRMLLTSFPRGILNAYTHRYSFQAFKNFLNPRTLIPDLSLSSLSLSLSLSPSLSLIIIIMYNYHALINALSAHITHHEPKYDILYTRRAQSHQNNPHKAPYSLSLSWISFDPLYT